ncbi:MAG: cytochrome b/b6 domain-containing protein [Desulfitobacterium sp.]|nr:cytochrome b/b6 domain-containing protein [Desulfitobacterium sp.]
MRKTLQKELTRAKINLSKGFPLPVRIFHWGFAFTLTGIILTGFILHKPLPFLALTYSKIFIYHVIFGWLATAFFIFRLVDMLIRKDKTLLPSLGELKNLPKLLAYYLFLRPYKPPSGQYNIGQKLIFISWLILFPFLVLLSLGSYFAGQHLDWVVKFIGGLQYLRMTKYLGAVYFVATILLHIYLSLTEDLASLQSMVTGYEQKEKAPKNRDFL